MQTTPVRGRAACRGATLVETLVAALLLAVGVLGTAVLLVHGLQANRSALLRSEAVGLAADLAERLRAGRGTVDLAAWQAELRARLPAPVDGSAAGALAQRAGASPAQPHRYRIRVGWSEPGRQPVWSESHTLDLPPAAAP
jgi:Tfp pilus assembly protein PilV